MNVTSTEPPQSPVPSPKKQKPPRPRLKRRPSPSLSASSSTPPCTECGRRFWSWKALFGHMRCHPERKWRGITPPTPPPDHHFSEVEREVAAYLVLLANGPPKRTRMVKKKKKSPPEFLDLNLPPAGAEPDPDSPSLDLKLGM